MKVKIDIMTLLPYPNEIHLRPPDLHPYWFYNTERRVIYYGRDNSDWGEEDDCMGLGDGFGVMFGNGD